MVSEASGALTFGSSGDCACLFTLLVGQAVRGLPSGGGAPVLLLGVELSASETRNQTGWRYLQAPESVESAGHGFWVAVYLQVAVVTQEC